MQYCLVIIMEFMFHLIHACMYFVVQMKDLGYIYIALFINIYIIFFLIFFYGFGAIFIARPLYFWRKTNSGKMVQWDWTVSSVCPKLLDLIILLFCLKYRKDRTDFSAFLFFFLIHINLLQKVKYYYYITFYRRICHCSAYVYHHYLLVENKLKTIISFNWNKQTNKQT